MRRLLTSHRAGLVSEFFPALQEGVSRAIHIIRALGFPKMGPVASLCQDPVRIKKRTEERELSCSSHDTSEFAFLTLAESTRNCMQKATTRRNLMKISSSVECRVLKR